MVARVRMTLSIQICCYSRFEVVILAFYRRIHLIATEESEIKNRYKFLQWAFFASLGLSWFRCKTQITYYDWIVLYNWKGLDWGFDESNQYCKYGLWWSWLSKHFFSLANFWRSDTIMIVNQNQKRLVLDWTPLPYKQGVRLRPWWRKSNKFRNQSLLFSHRVLRRTYQASDEDNDART